ncbi:MAG: tetratricopeptide repeat protein, partial [Planctomycetaceae bacterium]|nr:tetratricopeptide repeat protein [Planctomycetaceae bacterium]
MRTKLDSKLLLIGWDAADWKVINQLIAKGKMPTLQGLIERGSSGNLRTLRPALSPMLWTSIATGKRPFKHGITGFIEPTPDRKAVQPMTNLSRSSKAIWNILNQNDQKSIVVGWWPSHPAEPINGVMVSDYFHKAPKAPGASWKIHQHCVSPPEKQKELENLRVHPLEFTAEDILAFVPDAGDIDQNVDGRLASLMKITAECTTIHTTATHLLENEPWDFAAIYYDAIDHYSHGFMKYRTPQLPTISDNDHRLYRGVVDMGYIYHDMMLKQLLTHVDDQTTVLLISDHGFHSDHLRPVAIPFEAAGPASEHRDDGIFVAAGPRIRSKHVIHGANLLDVTPTILELCGLPVAADMDGRVLEDIFIDPPSIDTIDSWDTLAGNSGQHPTDRQLATGESKSVIDQLIALGYVDPQDENNAVNVTRCENELRYNLARSYMDAELHSRAMTIFYDLYMQAPIDFRFGIQLANCFRAQGSNENLRALIQDIEDRWEKGSSIAKARLNELNLTVRDRKAFVEKLIEIQKDQDLIDGNESSPHTEKIFNNDEQRSIKQLKSVVEGNGHVIAYLQSTRSLLDQQPEDALDLLKKASYQDSKNPLYHRHIGQILIQLERYEEAEAVLKEGLEKDQCSAECHLGLSRCYLKQDRIRDAELSGKNAIQLKHHFPAAHYYLALAQRKTGNTSAATQSLKTAISQNPNFAEAHKALSEIYGKDSSTMLKAVEHGKIYEKVQAENRVLAKASATFNFSPLSVDELSKHLPSILFDGVEDDMLLPLGQPQKLVATLNHPDQGSEVVIVSGVPRSGTSMMMQMLVAGGLPAFTDGKRTADDSNPKGYFEEDRVKSLYKNNRWLPSCSGQVLKVVAPLVPYLPKKVHYKVIFMTRPMEQVLSSQKSMLDRMGRQDLDTPIAQLEIAFREQTKAAISLLRLHKIPTLEIDYKQAVHEPMQTAKAVQEFLGRALETNMMARTVDPSL